MLLSKPSTCHARRQKNVTTSLPMRPLEPVTSNFFTALLIYKSSLLVKPWCTTSAKWIGAGLKRNLSLNLLQHIWRFHFMRLLVTGICGFVGSTLAKCFLEMIAGIEILGMDSLIRPGSELNRRSLPKFGCKIIYGDVRSRSDLDQLPPVDWVIDAAANPSVSAGVSGSVSSRQLAEHNLLGTINLLEYCRRSAAGLILLSTSRVYSISALVSLPLNRIGNRFEPDATGLLPTGISREGISENSSTEAPSGAAFGSPAIRCTLDHHECRARKNSLGMATGSAARRNPGGFADHTEKNPEWLETCDA
jgi:NAD dependent epimerase/dehydratase family